MMLTCFVDISSSSALKDVSEKLSAFKILLFCICYSNCQKQVPVKRSQHDSGMLQDKAPKGW